MQRKEAVKPVGSTGLVKCLICGEVFDASLTICPTCGVGEENFVPAEGSAVTYRKDTDHSYVILGSGRAAVSAAEAIRQRDRTGIITMISLERENPYNRTMLTKNMFAGLEPKQFTVCDEDWFQRNQVRRVNGVIAGIDPARRTVDLADGRSYPYDKCVYTLGAYFFVPPFEGCSDPHVTTIRTLQDVETELLQYIDCFAKKEGGYIALVLRGYEDVFGAEKQQKIIEIYDKHCGRD